MRLNVAQAHRALTEIAALERAFIWERTPQGREYWERQAANGLDYEGRATIAFMVAQSIQFEMAGARASA